MDNFIYKLISIRTAEPNTHNHCKISKIISKIA